MKTMKHFQRLNLDVSDETDKPDRSHVHDEMTDKQMALLHELTGT